MSLHFVQFTTLVDKLCVHKESRIWSEISLHGPPQAGVHIVIRFREIFCGVIQRA